MPDRHNHHLLRRTKIIATLGPATDDEAVLEQVILAGANVVRLNCSHGSRQDQQHRIELIRRLAKKHDRIIGILIDLQGPKIRVARFKEGPIKLAKGDRFILDASLDVDAGDQQRVGIDYKALPQDVSAGDVLLLDDGRIQLEVAEVDAKQIHCTVLAGGTLSNNKGINRRGGGLTAKALTDKDQEDLKFAVKMQADYIAISFPRNAADIVTARHLMGPSSNTGIIAKIERAEAVAAVDEIIMASDGVMVARGDLAVEIGDAEVPPVQKRIIARSRELNKPVIIATQMMESMITSTVPTRAEVSDVANAVLDNADAVMLSAETAAGANPALVVSTMADVCLVAERQPESQQSYHRLDQHFERVDEAIAMATVYAANHLDITAIIALTESGTTPLWMSRIRSPIPIFALSRNPKTLGKMALYRRVSPIDFNVLDCPCEQINQSAIAALTARKLLSKGDLVLFTQGDKPGEGGGTNAMKILAVQE